MPSSHVLQPIRFATSDGLELEGEIRLPEAPARASAVICHALPTHGGSKDHPLLWAIRNELASRGFAVLAFNFRGNMGSQGEFAGGLEETRDVEAAVTRVREEARGPTLVVGWSFGANVALRQAMDDDRVGALALIGLPLGQAEAQVTPPLPPREDLLALDRPVLLIAGEADQFCAVPDVRSLGRRLPQGKVEIVAGGDHFFWRREREVARLVGDFAERSLLEGS